MSGRETEDSSQTHFEIIKVGRHWHWFPDVTIYYVSQTRSKHVDVYCERFSAFRLDLSHSNQLLVVSIVLEFKIKGGCKVREDSSQNYRDITVVMNRDENNIFQIRRQRGGGK